MRLMFFKKHPMTGRKWEMSAYYYGGPADMHNWVVTYECGPEHERMCVKVAQQQLREFWKARSGIKFED